MALHNHMILLVLIKVNAIYCLADILLAKRAKNGNFSPKFGLFLIGCISKTDCSILLKFGMLMEICNTLVPVLLYFQNFNFRQD